MGKSYRRYLPEQGFLLPPRLREWLPENHLVYFVSDVVDDLKLSALDAAYGGEQRGQPPYDPRMMTKVLVYGYWVGVFSSRRIERRLIEDVGFRVLAAGNTPNFRTIADFRKLHLATLAGLFEEVLQIALEAGALKLGRVALAGTKVGQCQQAQGDELWPDEGAGAATARRSAGTAGPGRGGGRH
jgi:transposase